MVQSYLFDLSIQTISSVNANSYSSSLFKNQPRRFYPYGQVLFNIQLYLRELSKNSNTIDNVLTFKVPLLLRHKQSHTYVLNKILDYM